jgi:hypothetical protein
MPRHSRAIPFLGMLLALGCGSDPGSDPILVGPEAKQDGDSPAAAFLCRIEAGDGGFASADTLRCESPEGARFVPSIDVRAADGSSLGSMRLSDGAGSVAYYADEYPLRVRAYGRFSDEILGLDDAELVSELVMDGAAGWETLRGPALPFEVWTVELEARVTIAQLSFEPYAVEAGDGMHFEVRGEPTPSLTVRPGDALVRAGETARLSFAAPSNAARLRGSVTIDGSPIPFELDRGGPYMVTREGLVPRTDFAPPETGASVVRCAATADESSCALVTRPGVTISEASVTTEGGPVALPLDGTSVDLSGASPQSARVVIADGIDGLDLTRFGTIEGSLEDMDGTPTMELPFALLHLSVGVRTGDVAYFDATDRHVVAFARAAGGLFESSDHLSVTFDGSRPEVWIAVSAGVSEIAGRLSVIAADGTVSDLDGVTLTEGSFELTRDGLTVPAPVEPGAELARCWLSEAALLSCTLSESTRLESARLTLFLESHDRSLGLDLRAGTSAVTSLGALLPVTLTLEVGIDGELVTSPTVRITQASDLPESAPLIVSAP